MRLELTFFGEVPSKKNAYRPVVRKNGKAQIIKDQKLREKLDYLLQQIPGEYWDLKLQHPAIMFQHFCPKRHFRRDRDNMLTCALDLLVKAGVLINDSQSRNNGRIVIEPTIVAPDFKTVITLETP